MSESPDLRPWPRDNRSDLQRYVDDIRSLSNMTAINCQLIEKALSTGRGKADEDGIISLNFTPDWLANLMFAANDLDVRTRALVNKIAVIDPEED